MEIDKVTKCYKCGCELPDSPPNPDICADCLVELVEKYKHKHNWERPEYDEG